MILPANLKVKLIIFLSVILLAVCGTLSFIFAFYSIESFHVDLKKRGMSEVSNLVSESKLGILTEDSEILMPLLVNKLSNPEILFIDVLNKENRVIASTKRYKAVEANTTEVISSSLKIKEFNISTAKSYFYIDEIPTQVEYYKITAPIDSIPISFSRQVDELLSDNLVGPLGSELSPKEIGEIYLAISLTSVNEKVRHVLVFVSLMTLAVLLLAIILAYLLAREALTPILTMSNLATQIASNDFKNVEFTDKSMILNHENNAKQYLVVSKSQDEIGVLANAFIKMSRRLKNYGATLELQVKERTEELSTALEDSRQLKTIAELANKKLLNTNNKLQLFQRCIEETTDFVLITNSQGQVHMSNQAFLKQTGYTEEQLRRSALFSFFSVDEILIFDSLIWPTVQKLGQWKGKTHFIKNCGSQYPVDLSITSVKDDQHEVIAYICIFRDVTQQHQHQQELIELASRDSLTGLLNRRRFLEELDKEISRCERQQLCCVLFWLDLDFFKEINDNLGHPAGDKLLISLAQNLKNHIRDIDIAARLGGDEFAILLTDTSLENAISSAERLIYSIRTNRVMIDKEFVRMTISMGGAMYPGHGLNSDELLASADLALYKSKDAGRNQFSFFQSSDKHQEKLSYQNIWTQRIWDALEQNRLQFFHQPIVDTSDGKASHYELLLRMYDENGHIVMPESFVPLAEQTGIIQTIDRWVIRHAAIQYSESGLQKRQCKIAINLSAKALDDDGFPDYIEAEFKQAGIDPKMVIIEITENSAITEISKAVRFINRLKVIGCEFALDDFGVGFASFSHLKNLDISYLKIDGSFITEITTNAKDRGIVEGMIRIAHSLNIKTVAECVNSAETMALLKDLGIDYVQGFYLGEPEELISRDEL